MTLSYFNIQKFCIHDGPGIRTTVFLKGCPLNCLWCHNPESKHTKVEVMFHAEKCTGCGRCLGFCDARKRGEDGRIIFDRSLCTACGKCAERCFNHAIRVCGKQGSIEDILEQVRKDKPFYETSGGGMTISGGEPAMQPEAVLALIEAAKAEGIASAIETCGFGNREFFIRAHELGALFLFDIKGIDPEKHKANTGVYPDLIHKNLDMLLEMGAKVIIRLPLIPGKNDSEEDLRLLTQFLAQRKDRGDHADIMAYHELGVSKSHQLGVDVDDTIPAGKEFAEGWRSVLRESGVEIRISGE